MVYLDDFKPVEKASVIYLNSHESSWTHWKADLSALQPIQFCVFQELF